MIDGIPLSDLPPGMRDGDETPEGDEDRDAREQLEAEKGEEQADFDRNEGL